MNRKLKIAMLAPYPAQAVLPPEDIAPSYRDRAAHAAPWVRALTMALAQRDEIEFRIFVHSRAVRQVKHGTEKGVEYTFIPQYEPKRIERYLMYAPARIQLGIQLRKYRPDLIHGFGTESCYGLIAANYPVPGLVFIQGIPSLYEPYLDHPKASTLIAKRHERYVARKIDTLVAETHFAEKWANTTSPTTPVKIIPHAVNPEFFRVKPQYDTQTILCVGSLDRRKAVDAAITAMHKVSAPHIQLHIIGTGPLKESLVSLARDLGLLNQVVFCGSYTREQIMQEMSHALGLAILSRMDTSPNILTEAHAAGLPVIGAKSGGIPDMIEHNTDGFLVDVDDVEATATYIKRLADNTSLCREMGEAGRRKVQTLNDPKRIADEHIKIYKELANQAHDGA